MSHSDNLFNTPVKIVTVCYIYIQRLCKLVIRNSLDGADNDDDVIHIEYEKETAPLTI